MNLLGRPWWASALRGIIALAFGLVAIFSPARGANFLLTFLALFVLINGAIALGGGIWSLSKRHGGWSLILEGLAGLAAGILVISWPQISALIAVFIIGIWAITLGVLQITAAIFYREYISGEWMLVLTGVLSVIFGFALLGSPAAGIFAVVWLTGIWAIAYGLFEIGSAFRYHHLLAHGGAKA